MKVIKADRFIKTPAIKALKCQHCQM